MDLAAALALKVRTTSEEEDHGTAKSDGHVVQRPTFLPSGMNLGTCHFVTAILSFVCHEVTWTRKTSKSQEMSRLD
jgi:hypothetical protein